MFALTLMLLANGQLPVQDKLDQIERTFICPEDLPSDEARQAALELFLAQVQAVEPGVTPRQLVEYRYSLLVRHRCAKTLEIMERAKQPQAR